MRHHHLNALALAGLLGLAPLGAAESTGAGGDVAIDQVPAPVRTTIQREAAGQDVRWVQRGEVGGGKAVYTARIRQDGLDKRVVVDETGALISAPDLGGSSSGAEPERDRRVAGGDVDRRQVPMDQLPAAVRETIGREAKGEPVRWIVRDLDQGTSVYQARIRQEGLDKRVTIDEHGAVLAKRDWGQDDQAAADDRDPAAREADRRDAERANDRDLERDIALEQAPLPVQQTIKREAGGEPVQWVQRDNDQGSVVYHARIKQEGIDQRLTVSPAGDIIEKKDFSELNSKSGRAWEKTKEVSKDAWEKTKDVSSRTWDKATDAVHGDHLTVADLPPAVKATVEREAAGREISDVDHELKQGKHLYDVKIHVPDAKDVHLRIDEDGKLLGKQ